jgi:hypothetical protein
MFLGPYEEGGDFRDQSISGVRRFLDRVWSSVAESTTEGSPDPEVMRKLHQTIGKVTEDIPRLAYNTAIAAMMTYVVRQVSARRTDGRAAVQLVAVRAAPGRRAVEQLGRERADAAGRNSIRIARERSSILRFVQGGCAARSGGDRTLQEALETASRRCDRAVCTWEGRRR